MVARSLDAREARIRFAGGLTQEMQHQDGLVSPSSLRPIIYIMLFRDRGHAPGEPHSGLNCPTYPRLVDCSVDNPVDNTGVTSLLGRFGFPAHPHQFGLPWPVNFQFTDRCRRDGELVPAL